MEWIGVVRCGVWCGEVEWSGVGWCGMEWSGVWSENGMDLSGMEWSWWGGVGWGHLHILLTDFLRKAPRAVSALDKLFLSFL